MKLIVAIVQDEDSAHVVSELMGNGFSVTKLATTGGFLRSGNTTLLIGTEETLTEKAISIIESQCKCRKRLTASPAASSIESHSQPVGIPFEVTVGGATVFVLSVDSFLKV